MTEYIAHPLSLLADISYIGVFFCVIIAYIVGFIWYNPNVFGLAWMHEVGMKQKIFITHTPRAMLISLPILFALALYVAGWYRFIGGDSVIFAMGLGFDLGSMACLFLGILYLYEMRTFRLFMINAGFILTTMMTMGLIIGIFG